MRWKYSNSLRSERVLLLATSLFTYCEDAFLNNKNGKGFLWGLCHINPDGGGAVNKSILARFDCDLSSKYDHKPFKRNNLRFNKNTYLQSGVRLSEGWVSRIKNERKDVDNETIR